jgi:hypothetical protein
MATRELVFARLYLLPILSKIGTRKLQSFVVRRLPWNSVRRVVDLVDCMHNTSVEIIKDRKIALREGKEAMDRQVGRGKDIMSILCEIPAVFHSLFPLIQQQCRQMSKSRLKTGSQMRKLLPKYRK